MLVGKMEVRVKVHNMTKKDFVLVIPSDDASTPATVLRAPLTLFLSIIMTFCSLNSNILSLSLHELYNECPHLPASCRDACDWDTCYLLVAMHETIQLVLTISMFTILRTGVPHTINRATLTS